MLRGSLLEANIWILGITQPQVEVVIFSVPTRMINLVVIPLLLVNTVLPSTITELYELGNTKQLERTLRVTATVAGIPAFMVLIVFILFGRQFLFYFFEEFYIKSYPMLVILSLGQLINVFTGSCGLTLIMASHEKMMMLSAMISGMITLGLSLKIAEHYGAIRIAVSVTIGIILYNLSLWLLVRYKTGLWTLASISALFLLIRSVPKVISRVLINKYKIDNRA